MTPHVNVKFVIYLQTKFANLKVLEEIRKFPDLLNSALNHIRRICQFGHIANTLNQNGKICQFGYIANTPFNGLKLRFQSLVACCRLINTSLSKIRVY